MVAGAQCKSSHATVGCRWECVKQVDIWSDQVHLASELEALARREGGVLRLVARTDSLGIECLYCQASSADGEHDVLDSTSACWAADEVTVCLWWSLVGTVLGERVTTIGGHSGSGEEEVAGHRMVVVPTVHGADGEMRAVEV